MRAMMELNFEEICKKIEDFIRDFVEKCEKDGVVVGLSGGVDSSVTACLCVRALTPSKVYGLILPDRTITPQDDVIHAKFIANKLKINYSIIDIWPIFSKYLEALRGVESNKVAEGNLRARIRMGILYYFANSMNRLVVGTGDRSELLIGYFTKYGDGGVDFLPIGGLYKTQVRALAKYLGVPEFIINKPSSPRLWKNHLAENELGMSYETIDTILHSVLDLKMSPSDVSKKYRIPMEHIKAVMTRVSKSEHKRRMPPIAIF